MLALNIPELKNFMNQLLCSDTFDHFLLKEATIQKDAIWNFDGTITSDFYSEDELEEQGLWQSTPALLRPDQRKTDTFLF